MGSGLTAQERTIVMYNRTYRFKNVSVKPSEIQRFHFSKQDANTLLKYQIELLFKRPAYVCQMGSRIYSTSCSIKQLKDLKFPNQSRILTFQLHRFMKEYKEHISLHRKIQHLKKKQKFLNFQNVNNEDLMYESTASSLARLERRARALDELSEHVCVNGSHPTSIYRRRVNRLSCGAMASEGCSK